MKKKVELLSPAGEFNSVIGAINAGADAVYLGCEDFSARAYAKNLSLEEVIEMIRYAHLFHRKIYLTMNTLLKTVELNRALVILDRLYVEGLDAVIVQDLGLINLMHERYPEMEIHASTQLAILSSAGIEWLKQYHVTRVVPGRELSYQELLEMKKTGIELECFIHGAMCYSYSGKCLMSSLAGGRSGNRGRCAGPCRKLYHRPGREAKYLLSMKDMCTVYHMEAMMKAGIDSFKIEGRMKAPEYSAGVTSVYRGIIDRIMRGESGEVKKEEMEILRELYIRSEIQEGYLYKHNAKNMISINNPAYAGCSEMRKENVREKYLKGPMKFPVSGYLIFCQNCAMELTLWSEGVSVTVKGDEPQPAIKRALTNEEIEKQINKLGNTFFEISELQIENDGQSFAAVSQLKELRRQAISLLENEILGAKRETVEQSDEHSLCKAGDDCASKNDYDKQNYIDVRNNGQKKAYILVGVKTKEQLMTYTECVLGNGVILDFSLLQQKDETLKRIPEGIEIFLRMPEVIREKDRESIAEELKKVLPYFFENNRKLQGIYCGSVDAMQMAALVYPQIPRIADYGLYVMNEETENTVLKEAFHYTASFELNKKELAHAIRKDVRELVVYGHIPVMYSANCVLNTTEHCDKSVDLIDICDEDNRKFPIIMNHDYCYNTIYNCVPVSLHSYVSELLSKNENAVYRLEFTVETGTGTNDILEFYKKVFSSGKGENKEESLVFPGEYTGGHFNRGVL